MFKFTLKGVLLTLWIAFSFGYIAFDAYTKFQNVIVKGAFIAGQESTINEFLDKIGNKDCSSVTLYNKKENKEIEVISVTCLKEKSQPLSGSANTSVNLSTGTNLNTK